MSHKRLMAIGFLIFILEIGLIALWFYRAEPTMLSAMDIFKVIPILFGINLLFRTLTGNECNDYK